MLEKLPFDLFPESLTSLDLSGSRMLPFQHLICNEAFVVPPIPPFQATPPIYHYQITNWQLLCSLNPSTISLTFIYVFNPSNNISFFKRLYYKQEYKINTYATV